jgi:hypothetical protein
MGAAGSRFGRGRGVSWAGSGGGGRGRASVSVVLGARLVAGGHGVAVSDAAVLAVDAHLTAPFGGQARLGLGLGGGLGVGVRSRARPCRRSSPPTSFLWGRRVCSWPWCSPLLGARGQRRARARPGLAAGKVGPPRGGVVGGGGGDGEAAARRAPGLGQRGRARGGRAAHRPGRRLGPAEGQAWARSSSRGRSAWRTQAWRAGSSSSWANTWIT